jgi:hypothetical protein
LQLTTAQNAPESTRNKRQKLWSATNRLAVPAVIAFLGWLAFVLARWQVWARGHFNRFVMLGSYYSHSHYLPSGMRVADPGAKGYDGQFYYRLSLNPFNWHHTAYGITMDQTYRYTRLGYPILGWLASAGQHQAVPIALIAINLVCVTAMAVLGGMFARDAGRHPIWGLAFAAYFGLVISIGRDTAEPLAEACMLAGLLAYRRGRWLLAAAAFGYGGLTRETILLAPAAITVTRLVPLIRSRLRFGRQDLAWVIPAAVLVAVQVTARIALIGGRFPLYTNWRRNLTTPFTAMVDALRYAGGHIDTSNLGLYDITLVEYVTLGIFVLAGFAVLFVTTAPVHERIAFVVSVLIVCALSNQIWGSVFGDGRSMVEPYLFALILLIATPKRYVNAYVLTALAAAAVPALFVVARRRILYM